MTAGWCAPSETIYDPGEVERLSMRLSMRHHIFEGDGEYCQSWSANQGGAEGLTFQVRCGWPRDLHPKVKTFIRHHHTPRVGACRWCGFPEGLHDPMRWIVSKGWHLWERPTDAQIEARRRAGGGR